MSGSAIDNETILSIGSDLLVLERARQSHVSYLGSSICFSFGSTHRHMSYAKCPIRHPENLDLKYSFYQNDFCELKAFILFNKSKVVNDDRYTDVVLVFPK